MYQIVPAVVDTPIVFQNHLDLFGGAVFDDDGEEEKDLFGALSLERNLPRAILEKLFSSRPDTFVFFLWRENP